MEKHTLKRITIDEIPEPSVRLFDPKVAAVAMAAIEAIRAGGEAALREWAVKFDGLPGDAPLVISRDEMRAAYESLPHATAELLARAKGRVAAFAAAQRACLAPLDLPAQGGRHGHEFVPVERAGCYVPGGAFPLPSSAIMTVVPAKTAGVEEVWCAGPKPTPETLAAAWLAGADGFLRCGGAHAIATLAFGVAVPKCNVIVGPGGKYVAAAKRLLYGLVGTEAPAGPSELLIIADATANPEIVAADLLAQAEHSPDAMPALIVTDENSRTASRKSSQASSAPCPNRTAASPERRSATVSAASSPTSDEPPSAPTAARRNTLNSRRTGRPNSPGTSETPARSFSAPVRPKCSAITARDPTTPSPRAERRNSRPACRSYTSCGRGHGSPSMIHPCSSGTPPPSRALKASRPTRGPPSSANGSKPNPKHKKPPDEMPDGFLRRPLRTSLAKSLRIRKSSNTSREGIARTTLDRAAVPSLFRRALPAYSASRARAHWRAAT